MKIDLSNKKVIITRSLDQKPFVFNEKKIYKI